MRLRWVMVGRAMVEYDEKWSLKVNVLFFHKQWDLEKIIFKEKKKRRRVHPRKKKKKGKENRLSKFLNVLKSFRITKWQLAIDTGDTVKNAWLYPLNFSVHSWNHLRINFTDENYLVLVIRNTPWKIAYAVLKK